MIGNSSTLIQTPISHPATRPATALYIARQVQAPVLKQTAAPVDNPASPATTASSSELSDPPSSPAPPRHVPAPAQPRLVKPPPVPAPKAPAPVVKGKLNVPAPATRTRPTANNKTTAAPKVTTIKRLTQAARSTVESYHTSSNTTFMELRQTSKMADSDFVAFFIRGLRDPTHREKLSKELVKSHPARGREDGTVEILCMWEDVGDALRKVGLLPEVQFEGMAQPPKRKKMTLLPPGMMIDNLMR